MTTWVPLVNQTVNSTFALEVAEAAMPQPTRRSPYCKPCAPVWRATWVENESTDDAGRGVKQLGGGGVMSLLTRTTLPHAARAIMATAIEAIVAAERTRRAPRYWDIGGKSYPDAAYNRCRDSSKEPKPPWQTRSRNPRVSRPNATS